MIKRTAKFIQTARGTMVLNDSDAKIVKKYMPYAPLSALLVACRLAFGEPAASAGARAQPILKSLFEESPPMARVKRGVTAHAKHKKVLKAAKGYYGRRKNTIRVAKQAVEKAHAVRLSRPQAPQAQRSARSGSSASTPPCASTA